MGEPTPAQVLKKPSDKPPKIEEVETPVKESPPTEAKNESAKKSGGKKLPAKTKMLDEDTVKQAAERATIEANNAAIKTVPKTAAGFEKDYHQLEKNTEHVYQYLKNISFATVESLFRRTELEAQLLSGVLKALSSHGLEDGESCKHAG